MGDNQENSMEELIKRIMAAAGIEEDTARSAIGIILGFLNKEGPEDKMQLIFDALPGAQELVEAREAVAAVVVSLAVWAT